MAVDGALEPHVPCRSLRLGQASRRGRLRPEMTKKAKIELSALEGRIGHAFHDRSLLARALTHLSAPAAGGADRTQSYQRLEFLGDRVLGVVIADMLYQGFPQASEGELSMRLAKLVRRETCAAVAAEWDVGPHVAMGQGEARAGGRKKEAILADICEAIIGAAYLDAGFAAAHEVVARSWRPRMDADVVARARRQDRGAGMGPGARPVGAALRRIGAQRSGPRAAFRHAGGARGLRAGKRRSELQARRGTGRRTGVPRASERRVSETRCGFVALVGAPNAGKSTLLNSLIGAKVSIVSRKAQTTRATVRGILVDGAAQMIFVDTPGLFAPKRRLDRAMVAAAWGAAGDADALALLIDARQEIAAAEQARERPRSARRRRRFSRLCASSARRNSSSSTRSIWSTGRVLLALAERLNAALPFADTFMTSALTGDGLDRLKARLAAAMPKGPWLYPEDQIADAPLRALAAEITREKLFERLHDELPYQTTVETESWKDQPDGSARVEQTIYVTRDSHKKIVIGEGGRTIKAIGSAARKEIAEAHEAPVHLFLFVKVRANWLDDPERYRAMGLEFPKT